MSSDATRLAALYAAEHDRLRRLLIRRGVPAWAAADVVQEAFLRLMRVPADELKDPKSYLMRIIGNIVVDEHRRHVRTEAIFDASADVDDGVADQSAAPDKVLMSSEESAALQRALDELPPRAREVLLLHRFDGLTYAEIAERLGISKNTVMVHLTNALGALRRRMKESSGGD